MRKQPDNKGNTTNKSAIARRELFKAAYLSNGKNATQAAITAGFSQATAGQKGCSLLQEPRMKESIAQAEQELLNKHKMTAESVLLELSRIVHFDIRKLYNVDGSLKSIHELDDDTACALASFEIEEIVSGDTKIGLTRKVKAADKNSAIEKAMKHFNLFSEDNTLKIVGNVTISKDDAGLC